MQSIQAPTARCARRGERDASPALSASVGQAASDLSHRRRWHLSHHCGTATGVLVCRRVPAARQQCGMLPLCSNQSCRSRAGAAGHPSQRRTTEAGGGGSASRAAGTHSRQVQHMPMRLHLRQVRHRCWKPLRRVMGPASALEVRALAFQTGASSAAGSWREGPSGTLQRPLRRPTHLGLGGQPAEHVHHGSQPRELLLAQFVCKPSGSASRQTGGQSVLIGAVETG